MEFRLYHFDNDVELNQLVNLQNEVYQERELHFKAESFKAWYVENPDGGVISYNAFDGNKMVAHQSFVPELMDVDGRLVRCLRSMAVVTHPGYQRRGLFARLTNLALDEAKRQGYEFAYAISNANSTPVFIKHCGFKQITRLQVKIGFGNGITERGDHTYKRHWTPEALRWRLGMKVYCRHGNSVIGNYKYGVQTYMATLDSSLLDTANLATVKWPLALRLYVGLGGNLPCSYVDVPRFVKHSPFNLIFQDLTGGCLPAMTAENVFYQLLNYDVS